MKAIKINNNSVPDDFKDTRLVRVKDVLGLNENLKERLLKLYPLKTGMTRVDLKARNMIKEIFDIIKQEIEG